ncbi:MAG: protein phosphatase 2C domain-containing protein [Candidatus Thorarchaeota archaeon]
MMYADSVFNIGSTHRVCEDYALHGLPSSEFPFRTSHAILSDGCSSAVDTDFGSRILAKAAQQFIHRDYNKHSAKVFGNTVMAKATTACAALGLMPTSLFATLGAVFADPEYFRAFLFGDGVIAYIDNSGLMGFQHIQFPKGAPFYLLYETESALKKGYIDQFGGTYTITNYERRNGKWEREEHDTFQIQADSPPDAFSQYSLKGHQLVAIMSDGVDSVYKKINTETTKTTENVPITEVVEELLSFKPVLSPNYNGAFVQRRIAAAFKNNPDWEHGDDISIAALAYRKE